MNATINESIKQPEATSAKVKCFLIELDIDSKNEDIKCIYYTP